MAGFVDLEFIHVPMFVFMFIHMPTLVSLFDDGENELNTIDDKDLLERKFGHDAGEKLLVKFRFVCCFGDVGAMMRARISRRRRPANQGFWVKRQLKSNLREPKRRKWYSDVDSHTNREREPRLGAIFHRPIEASIVRSVQSISPMTVNPVM
eukprot:scaffold6216_cov149-Amphora_coffeaeformis.AAC.6